MDKPIWKVELSKSGYLRHHAFKDKDADVTLCYTNKLIDPVVVVTEWLGRKPYPKCKKCLDLVA